MSELETFVTDFNSDLYGRSTGADGSAPHASARSTG